QLWYYGKYDIVKENKIWVNRAHTCKSPGGCLYFPEPSHSREKALGSYAKAYVEMLEELAAKYEFLWNPTSSAEQQERQYAPQPNYPGFDYYARTIRAFDAYLMPERLAFEEITDGKMRFWKPP